MKTCPVSIAAKVNPFAGSTMEIGHFFVWGVNMPRKRIDLTGRTFGYLTVIGFSHYADNGATYWMCRCVCGKTYPKQRGDLFYRKNPSCGCKRLEALSIAAKRHGGSINRAASCFAVWESMKQRCVNPNAPCYARYGGRGISVCQRWMDSFEAFAYDMGPRPDGTSIDRIDNDGDYEPSNCRWGTREEQNNNRSNTVHVTANGETLPITEWMKRTGLPRRILRWRVQHGWDGDDAVSIPVGPSGPKKFNRMTEELSHAN